MSRGTLAYAERVWLGRIYKAAAKKAIERTSGKTPLNGPGKGTAMPSGKEDK